MTPLCTLLVVTAVPANPTHGSLRCGDQMLPCILGRSSIRAQKREGDGATPKGRFSLRRVLYRADRVPTPKTELPAAAIARDDGWCDEPEDPRYNQSVKLPYPVSAEPLWREDHLYDLVVVLGHNDDPVVPGHGSAIFMHIAATDGEPTAGCVALQREHLLSVLGAITAGATLDIRD